MVNYRVEIVNFVEGAGRVEFRIIDSEKNTKFEGVVYHGNMHLIVENLVNAYAKGKPHKYETIMVKE
jgi:hypothetical protein